MHGFGQNVKLCHVSIFRKISQKNVFNNSLNRKCIHNYKNEKLKNSKNWDFSKGVSL